jgi:uncharacterized membrane protein
MNSTKLTQALIVAAVMGAAATVSAGARADDMKMDKCYGVAKAGENSCASAKGGHSCAGQSKASYSGEDFKAVPAGTCEKMNGSLKPFDGANPKIKG